MSNENRLGAVPGTTTAGLHDVLLNGGGLTNNGTSIVISPNRGIDLGPAGGILTAPSGATTTYNGVIADAPGGVPGNLAITGFTTSGGNLVSTTTGGTVSLGGSNTFTGTVAINSAGTLSVANTGNFASSLTFNGGTLSLAGGRTGNLNFNGTILNPGISTISANLVLGANPSMGSITHNAGGNLNFGTLNSSRWHHYYNTECELRWWTADDSERIDLRIHPWSSPLNSVSPGQ